MDTDPGAQRRDESKPATAARMYDYYLGGIHNFPADREAAEQVIALLPGVPGAARANRAFLRRAVRYLVEAGIRQFLDLGSGIPTAGNVHEIAQALAPESRVVYVDIDTVAVAESLDILRGNPNATALRADVRDAQAILRHPDTRRVLDFTQPVGLLIAGVLNFIPDDEQAYALVAEFIAGLVPGSYLAISHGAADGFAHGERLRGAETVYNRQTKTPGKLRTEAETRRFFDGTRLLDPGVVWAPQWHPELGEPDASADSSQNSGIWAGVGRKERPGAGGPATGSPQHPV